MKKNDLSKLKHIVRQINIAKKTAIKVGLPSDVGHYPGGESVVEVGTDHEYGLGVPRRSFIRVPMEKEKNTLQKAINSGFKNILNGGDTKKNLVKLGIVAENISKGAFKNDGYGTWKKLSDYTIEQKGSDRILFDTGKLVQSITSWVVKV